MGYKIPNWFLNRQKDIKGGKTGQVMANFLDNKLREDLERLKNIRAHRGLRHYWVSVLEVNIPRPLAVAVAPLVYLRRSKQVSPNKKSTAFVRKKKKKKKKKKKS